MAKKEEHEVSLAVLDNLKTVEEFQLILDSGAIPSNLDTVQKLQTVIKTGQELGLQAMTSINNINVIKGRTVISAAILGALLKKHGKEWIWTKDFFVEEDGKIVTELEFEWISPVTKKPKSTTFSVSWKQFEVAGYTDKENWKKYP